MGALLIPDGEVLHTIFPTAKPTSVKVLANNFETCTFRVLFYVLSTIDMASDLTVQMETSTRRLQAVTALQKLVHLQIPTLIAKTCVFGKATTANKQEVEYTVSEYIADTVTLKLIWPNLPATQKEAVVRYIAEVLRQIRALPLDSKSAQSILLGTPWLNENGSKMIEGPVNRHFNSVVKFLVGFAAGFDSCSTRPGRIDRKHHNPLCPP
jgi:hypothetical protein